MSTSANIITTTRSTRYAPLNRRQASTSTTTSISNESRTSLLAGLPPLAEEVSSLTTDEESKVVLAQVLSLPSSVATEANYVNLKTLDDRTIRIQTSPAQTLREFRIEVERVTGVTITNQRLISNGRLLTIEDEPLNLEIGSFVHLAPITRSPSGNNRGSDDNDEGDDEVEEYYPETVVQRYISQLHALAWLVVMIFTLSAWRLFMAIAFDDDGGDPPTSQTNNIARFLMSLFGIAVGLQGVNASYTRNRSVLETRTKVRVYVGLLALLSLFYLLTTVQEFDENKNSFVAVLLIQSTFWYCILQAEMTHRALRISSSSPSSTQVAPNVSNSNPIIVAVPYTSHAQQPNNNNATELTMFSSNNNINTTTPTVTAINVTTSLQQRTQSNDRIVSIV